VETVDDVSTGEHRFSLHVHDEHELLWGATVRFTVEHGDRVWVVPPMLGVWVPAGVPHGGYIAANGRYSCTFFDPERFPVNWAEPTPVAITPVVRELIRHAGDRSLPLDVAARIEQLVVDLLEPIATWTVHVPIPHDERARIVANGILTDPADDRGLDAWSRAVNASSRNLTRLFEAQTGMSFTRWRTHARISVALTDLAAGADIATAARRVGYANVSAFGRTFKLITGQAPSEYRSLVSRVSHPRDVM
jgi:AraC-like DNA-binding protein